MIKNGMYFAKEEIYDLIRSLGGEWNDSKERPLVCVIKSNEVEGLYFAVPVGNYEHRNDNAKDRIQHYLDMPENRIESCFITSETQQSNLFSLSLM